eukprot:g5597.t1
MQYDSTDVVGLFVKDSTHSTKTSLEALKASLQLDARNIEFFQEELKQTLSAANEACWKHIGISPCDPELPEPSPEINTVSVEDSFVQEELTVETECEQRAELHRVELPIHVQTIDGGSQQEFNSWSQFVHNQHKTADQLSFERQFAAIVKIQSQWRTCKARKQFQITRSNLAERKESLLNKLKARLKEQSVIFRVVYDPSTSEAVPEENVRDLPNTQPLNWLPKVKLRPNWSLHKRLTMRLEEWKKMISETKINHTVPTSQVVEGQVRRQFKDSDSLLPLRGLIKHRSFAHLQRITKLVIEDEAMESLVGDLGKLLPNLESLNINNSGVRDLSSILSCSNLTNLRLKGNSLTEVSSLGNLLPRLKSLSLARNRIELLGEWKLPVLHFLDLSWNQIQSLSGTIWQCTRLEKLDVSHNELTRLDDITYLSQLMRLDISHNQVRGLQDLCSCSTLTWLDLSNNGLQGTFPNLFLPCLVTLYLNDNAITNMSSSFFLPSLTLLSLRGNRVENIEEIGEIYNLIELDLSFNKLESVQDLTVLERLRRLQSLRLTENESYFGAFKVLDLIPWIRSLDDEVVPLRAQKKALWNKLRKNPSLLLKIRQWIQKTNKFVDEEELSPSHLLEFLQKDLLVTPELRALHSLTGALHAEGAQNQGYKPGAITRALRVLAGEDLPEVDYTESAKIIQRIWKAYKARNAFILRLQRTKSAVSVIGKYWREYVEKKRGIALRERRHFAACTIQSYFRSFHIRKRLNQTLLVTKQSIAELNVEDLSPCEDELDWIQSLDDVSLEADSFLDNLDVYKVEVPTRSEPIGKAETSVEENLKHWDFQSATTLNNYCKSWNRQRKQRNRKRVREKMKDPQVRLKEFHEKAKRVGEKRSK